MIEGHDILLADATIMVGILIFYTVPFIAAQQQGTEKKQYIRTKTVLYSIVSAAGLFSASAVSAILSYFSTSQLIISYLTIAEWLTLIGFIVVFAAVLIMAIMVKKELKVGLVTKRQSIMCHNIPQHGTNI